MQCHLATPPPILSRVFQELSNGALGFNQAVKLSDVPFPFIFAQLLTLTILCFAIVSPIAFTVITGLSWFTPVISSITVTSFIALNQLAMELENPYGDQANTVPVMDLHERFVEGLVELYSMHLPNSRVAWIAEFLGNTPA